MIYKKIKAFSALVFGMAFLFASFGVVYADSTNSTSTLSAASANVFTGSSTTITITRKDDNGNALSGKNMTLSSNRSGDTITFSSNTTNSSGVATATVSSNTAGTSTYTATDLTASTNYVTLNQTTSVAFITPTVTNSSGGTVNSSDSQARATFSADTFSIPGVISQIQKVSNSNIPSIPSSYKLVGNVYDFTATDANGNSITTFNKNARIEIDYSNDLLGNLPTSAIAIYYYQNGSWHEVTSTVDTSRRKVIAEVNHFTNFAVLANKSGLASTGGEISYVIGGLILLAIAGVVFYRIQKYKKESFIDGIYTIK